MARRALRKLGARLRERGLRATLAKAFCDHVFRVSTSVVMAVDAGQIRRRGTRVFASGGFSGAMVRTGEPLPPLCPFLAPRQAAFAAMLRAGKVGVFVLRGDTAVGCAWLALEDHHDAEARESYPVAPGEAYHYCWLVDPAERCRGASLASARFTDDACRLLGIRRQFGVVDRTNRPSYRVLHYFGYRECGQRVRHVYLLHRRWTLTSSYRGTLGPRGAAA